ncbi:hypothetical protein GCM10007874_40560 [Labrys miyagiensis]|uniref:DUF4167 domain-containing protein n=1 Tax=Labrys miyagiensis TaxID=346912 RepID=A0ABQ6CLH1_9HYPH|nr:hypothetical protein GCM10007874_40560 [Labrys miyagiensis]
MNMNQSIVQTTTNGSQLKQSTRANSARGRSHQNTRASYERYVTLAEAQIRAGDRVEAENYYQHAEHYFRLMEGRTS